jgi:predicted nucleotidyltransferase
MTARRDQHEVRLAFLFGSRARAGARPDSDFDIAVLLDPDAASQGRAQDIADLEARITNHTLRLDR